MDGRGSPPRGRSDHAILPLQLEQPERDSDAGRANLIPASAHHHETPQGSRDMETWTLAVPFSPWKEVTVLLKIAIPIAMTRTLVNITRLASLLFVGRMTAPPFLAAASLAGSVSGVTGYSVMISFVGGLRTLAGQAYGAKDFSAVGYHLQCALILSTCTAVFSSLIWIFSKYLFIGLGQELLLSEHAAAYLIILIPSLFFFAFRATIQAWCTIQSIVRPFTYNAAITALISLPLNYLLVKRIGYLGSAISISLYTTINFMLDCSFVYFWGVYKKTWTKINLRRAMASARPMFVLALSSLIMVSEWWAAAVTVFMAGSLASSSEDPEAATVLNERTLSAMSIFQNVNGLFYMIPLGIQQAVSTRVANATGAGDPRQGKRSSVCGLAVSFCMSLLFATIMVSCRRLIGGAFAPDDEELVNLLASLMWLMALYHICDGGCAVLAGVLTGVGRQRSGAAIVVVCYFCIGIPVSYLCGYTFGLGVPGLVMGRLTGKVCHLIAYSFLVVTMDWQAQVEAAALLRKKMAANAMSPSMDDEDLEYEDFSEYDDEGDSADLDLDDDDKSSALLMSPLSQRSVASSASSAAAPVAEYFCPEL